MCMDLIKARWLVETLSLCLEQISVQQVRDDNLTVYRLMLFSRNFI